MAVERTTIKTVRVTPKEHEQIKNLADQAGVSWSRYVRQVALGERANETGNTASREEVKAILRELSSVGNLLNQIAVVANTSGAINPQRLDEALVWQERVTAQLLKLLKR